MDVLRGFWRTTRLASPAVVALLLYMALPSSTIFPTDGSSPEVLWQSAYLNVFDVALGYAIAVSWLSSRFMLDKETVLFLNMSLLVVACSLAFGSASAAVGPLIAGAVYWLRFALVFSFALCLTQRVGTQAAESLFIVLFIILCCTALAVFRLGFGVFNRIYASGMSVASFSQVTTVVAFVAILRVKKLLLVVASLFLVLTFSRTSLGLFALLYAFYIIRSQSSPMRSRATTVLLVCALMGIGLYLTKTSGQFEEIFATNDQRTLQTLDGRLPLWSYAFQVLASGSSGLFGIGFNRTLLLLREPSAVPIDILRFGYAHFHSIVLEYLIGMGVPSIAIFAVLLWRIGQTWRANCYPAALLFTFFLLSQSLDYTFYRPKEVICWALILGVAEGHWRLHGRPPERVEVAPVSPLIVSPSGWNHR